MEANLSDQDNQLLNTFLNRHEARESSVGKEAQRLVNMFRLIKAFKPEFVAQYNQKLLNSSHDVRMMLNEIVGGPRVRQYLEYLQMSGNQTASEETDQNVSESGSVTVGEYGYLPSPDEEFGEAGSEQSVSMMSDQYHSDYVKQALDAFSQKSQEQTAVLTEALKALKETVQKSVSLSGRSETSAVTVADFERWQAAQTQMIERVAAMQNETVAQLTQAFSNQVADILKEISALKVATGATSFNQEFIQSPYADDSASDFDAAAENSVGNVTDVVTEDEDNSADFEEAISSKKERFLGDEDTDGQADFSDFTEADESEEVTAESELGEPIDAADVEELPDLEEAADAEDVADFSDEAEISDSDESKEWRDEEEPVDAEDVADFSDEADAFSDVEEPLEIDELADFSDIEEEAASEDVSDFESDDAEPTDLSDVPAADWDEAYEPLDVPDLNVADELDGSQEDESDAYLEETAADNLVEEDVSDVVTEVGAGQVSDTDEDRIEKHLYRPPAGKSTVAPMPKSSPIFKPLSVKKTAPTESAQPSEQSQVDDIEILSDVEL